jgi:hypothetical protein
MADYAISNVPRRVVYAASGTGPYAFTFEILSQTDIAVYKASTLLTLTTDYTVTINTNGTGSVTLVVTAGTSNITIVGAKNIQRTTDFTTGGDLFANTLNDELDNQTIFIQQVAETAERGLKAPVIDPTDINMTLPAKATRAGTVLAFDSPSGNPVAGPTIASVGTVLGNIANINTVAGSISNVNTVATNITNVNTVAGISGNVTTVAGISANVTSVAGNASNINTVAGSISNVNAVGSNIANVNTVAGIDSEITTVAGIDSDVTTVAGIASDVSAVADIDSDVTTVAGIDSDVTAVAADATDIGAVAGNIANVNSVAGNATNINSVAGNSTNINTVAGISANVTTVAGISANVTTVAGISANVTTVAGNSANVTIAATNVADINNFADVYQGAKATDPTLRNDGSALQPGDLYFNTADDVMKVREGGAWLAAFVSLSGALIAANNLSDLTNKTTARQNLDLEIGVDVQAYDAQLADVAGLSPADNNFIVGNGTNFVAESGSTARTSLGLGSIATQDSSSVTITGGSINGTTVGGTTAAAGKFTTLEATDVATVSAGTVSAPAITTTGDTNTGIFFPAADTIAFAEGGAEAMRIASDGKVGIGTTSPGRELDVNGSIRFVSSGVIEAGGAGGLNTYIAGVEGGSGYWALAVNGAEQARLTVGGNLQFNSGYGSVATAYGCRAWVNFDGTTNVGGFCTIRASGGVTSITDNGTGDYTINFSFTFPDANYAVVVGAGAGIDSARIVNNTARAVPTTTAARFKIQSAGGSDTDAAYAYAAVFR